MSIKRRSRWYRWNEVALYMRRFNPILTPCGWITCTNFEKLHYKIKSAYLTTIPTFCSESMKKKSNSKGYSNLFWFTMTVCFSFIRYSWRKHYKFCKAFNRFLILLIPSFERVRTHMHHVRCNISNKTESLETFAKSFVISKKNLWKISRLTYGLLFFVISISVCRQLDSEINRLLYGKCDSGRRGKV